MDDFLSLVIDVRAIADAPNDLTAPQRKTLYQAIDALGQLNQFAGVINNLESRVVRLERAAAALGVKLE